MAKLRAYKHKRTEEVLAVGTFVNFDSEKCVIFVSEDGNVTYGTKEYLEEDYEAINVDVEIKFSF